MLNSLSDFAKSKPLRASAVNSVLQHDSDATTCHQSSVKVDTVVPTAALREPVPSIKATGTEAVPPESSPVNNRPLAKAENSSVQVSSTEAVPPEPNPVNDELLTKSGENGDSSLQLTDPEETREFKSSFWSKVLSHPEGATAGWDNSGLTLTSWWSQR